MKLNLIIILMLTVSLIYCHHSPSKKEIYAVNLSKIKVGKKFNPSEYDVKLHVASIVYNKYIGHLRGIEEIITVTVRDSIVVAMWYDNGDSNTEDDNVDNDSGHY
jgi:hypothetical protein